MSLCPQVRLPFGPLLAAANADNLDHLARMLGGDLHAARRRIYRWRVEGIPLHSADEAAVSIGLHPASVWPQDYWSACFEQDRQEAEWAHDVAMRAWLKRQGRSKRRARAELVVEYERLERHLRVVA